MARVTTGTGDDGYTDLLGSRRVPKYHPRVEVVGTLDEATSTLGLARALTVDKVLNDRVYRLQSDLYLLMAELATPPENYDKVDFKIVDDHVRALETMSDELKRQVEIGKVFVVPGGTPVGAALDIARTIVRRAERQLARLLHEGDITNSLTLQYLNRLSDLLFVMARHEEAGGTSTDSAST